MNPLSHTRTKRKFAFAMLLVWLFAIASGVANACLLDLPEAHFHASPDEHSEPHHDSEAAGHVLAIVEHDHDHHHSKTSKAPCLKACDDGSRAVLKQSSGVDHHDPGPAPLVAVLWAVVVPAKSALGRLDGMWVPPDGLPFRVRYSRLTL